jgi:hypothetical protein
MCIGVGKTMLGPCHASLIANTNCPLASAATIGRPGRGGQKSFTCDCAAHCHAAPSPGDWKNSLLGKGESNRHEWRRSTARKDRRVTRVVSNGPGTWYRLL